MNATDIIARAFARIQDGILEETMDVDVAAKVAAQALEDALVNIARAQVDWTQFEDQYDRAGEGA